MTMCKTAVAALAMLMLSACGSTPTAGPGAQPANQPVAAGAPQGAAHKTTETDTNESGLGTLASNGRGLMNCGKVRRTGSRIPRDVCSPDAFNGLYPSGVSMSTAKEVGPSWGN